MRRFTTVLVAVASVSVGGYAAPGSRPSIRFGAPIELADANEGTTGVVVADVTGDGRADVVIAPGGDGKLVVHPGKGDGTFAEEIRVPLGPSGFTTRMRTADLDGDGTADLVLDGALASSPALCVLVSEGDGRFRRSSYVADDVPDEVDQTFTVADWDGDGAIDIVAGGRAHCGLPAELRVWRNDGDGAFLPAETISTGPAQFSWIWDVVAADFDDDGRVDLAVLRGEATLVFWRQPDGSLVRGPDLWNQKSSSGALVATAADVDGDGLLDLAVVAMSLPVADRHFIDVYRHTSARSFAAPARYAHPEPYAEYRHTGGYWRSWDMTAADLDGDGRPEIVTMAALLPNAGDGTFRAALSQPFASTMASGVAVGPAGASGAPVVAISDYYGGGLVFPVLRGNVPPTVTGITSPLVRGVTNEVTVEGSGFAAGARLELGAGITVDRIDLVDATSLVASVTVSTDAAAGARAAVLRNPDGGSATASITIDERPPEVSTPTPPPTIDLVPAHGRCDAGGRPGRGSFTAAGTIDWNARSRDGLFDPASESARLACGDPSDPLVVVIPPEEGWTVRGGRATWSSPTSDRRRVRLVVDARRHTFRIDVRRAELAAAASHDVLVELSLGDDRGATTRRWTASRRAGALVLKDSGRPPDGKRERD